MPDKPDKNLFASLYAGQPSWDIGKPQKPFIDMAEQITGSILDPGCGTGGNDLFFASRGQRSSHHVSRLPRTSRTHLKQPT